MCFSVKKYMMIADGGIFAIEKVCGSSTCENKTFPLPTSAEYACVHSYLVV
jgi:hypothetical protein